MTHGPWSISSPELAIDIGLGLYKLNVTIVMYMYDQKEDQYPEDSINSDAINATRGSVLQNAHP